MSRYSTLQSAVGPASVNSSSRPRLSSAWATFGRQKLSESADFKYQHSLSSTYSSARVHPRDIDSSWRRLSSTLATLGRQRLSEPGVIKYQHSYSYTPRYFVSPTPTPKAREDGIADGDHAPPQKPRGLAVAVLRSACDGHKIDQLQSAEVGAVCVAVACQTSKQASRAIWSAGSQKATTTTTTRGGDGHNQGGGGRASSEVAPGSLRALLGRIRGFRGEAQHAACLVLYCKFPGAIMASPLDGSVFRLRREVGNEDASERETTDKVQSAGL